MSGGFSLEPPARRVVFWRHGRTEWNLLGRFQGQEDISLDEVGRQQARDAAAVLQHLPPARIFSSDLTRAYATARALGDAVGIAVQQDKRFRETFAGAWQGMTFAEIAGGFPEDQAAWRAGDPDLPAGGGESRTMVGARMAAATRDAVAGLQAGQTLVVVSHGGAIRAGLAALMGFPADRWGTLSGVSNCHWSVLEEQSVPGAHFTWQLTEHNIGLAAMPAAPLEG